MAKQGRKTQREGESDSGHDRFSRSRPPGVKRHKKRMDTDSDNDDDDDSDDNPFSRSKSPWLSRSLNPDDEEPRKWKTPQLTQRCVTVHYLAHVIKKHQFAFLRLPPDMFAAEGTCHLVTDIAYAREYVKCQLLFHSPELHERVMRELRATYEIRASELPAEHKAVEQTYQMILKNLQTGFCASCFRCNNVISVIEVNSLVHIILAIVSDRSKDKGKDKGKGGKLHKDDVAVVNDWVSQLSRQCEALKETLILPGHFEQSNLHMTLQPDRQSSHDVKKKGSKETKREPEKENEEKKKKEKKKGETGEMDEDEDEEVDEWVDDNTLENWLKWHVAQKYTSENKRLDLAFLTTPALFISELLQYHNDSNKVVESRHVLSRVLHETGDEKGRVVVCVMNNRHHNHWRVLILDSRIKQISEFNPKGHSMRKSDPELYDTVRRLFKSFQWYSPECAVQCVDDDDMCATYVFWAVTQYLWWAFTAKYRPSHPSLFAPAERMSDMRIYPLRLVKGDIQCMKIGGKCHENTRKIQKLRQFLAEQVDAKKPD